jgi:hypothetical protein
MPRHKIFLFTIILAPIWLYAQAPVLDANSGAGILQVQYTGRLFGYYRIEPPQSPSAEPYLEPVDKFLKSREQLNPNKDLRPLLLGMGDNFAPEMGASLTGIWARDRFAADCVLRQLVCLGGTRVTGSTLSGHFRDGLKRAGRYPEALAVILSR